MKWDFSSVGRALRSHRRGHWFESSKSHHTRKPPGCIPWGFSHIWQKGGKDMNFSFAAPHKILIQSGGLNSLHKHIAPLGKRFLFVTATALEKAGLAALVQKQIEMSGGQCFTFSGVETEPTVEQVEEARAFAIANKCDAVISLGGGSVMDTGKAAAALATNAGSIMDYLEGVGKELPIINTPLPFIAIPTTSGTGSEATKNAVIMSTKLGFKKSIRSDNMLARIALIDAELTLGLPPKQTAASGMDCLCQLIESYVTTKHNPIIDALSIKGIEHAGRTLKTAVLDGGNLEAREGMALASLLGGICLANAGLALAHGMAPALGMVKNLPHGLACGIALDHTMKVNLPAVTDRYARVGEAITGKRFHSDEAAAQAAIETVTQLKADTGIPEDLKGYDITPAELDALVEGSMASGTKVNPVAMTKESMRELYLSLM